MPWRSCPPGRSSGGWPLTPPRFTVYFATCQATSLFPPNPKLQLVTMRHALMYIGGFERNFANLTPSTTTFEGSDGNQHPYPAWPDSANGLRFGYMEKVGKKFVAVRVIDDHHDVVLHNELVLIPGQHFGFGARLGPEPTSVEDNVAILQLLEDIIKKNAAVSEPLLLMRARLKAAMTGKKK